MPSVIGFLREYLSSAEQRIHREATHCVLGNDQVPATLFRPASASRPLPGWIMLHGLTASGRSHPSLERFGRALAASGAVALAPEIAEWSLLRADPRPTGPILEAGLARLRTDAGVQPTRIGAIGFSFGATHALLASTAPRLAGRLAAIVAWGGYSDMTNLCRFGVTGEHGIDGKRFRIAPDRYGAWILGAQHVTGIAGLESAAPLAVALHQLATLASRSQIYSGDAALDSPKLALREKLPITLREAFDIFAPLAGRPPANLPRARELAEELARAALRAEPALDPAPMIGRVDTPNVLGHGLDDRLIPFTETIRLRRALPPDSCRGHTITALFGHSRDDARRPRAAALALETIRFVRLLNTMLNLR